MNYHTNTTTLNSPDSPLDSTLESLSYVYIPKEKQQKDTQNYTFYTPIKTQITTNNTVSNTSNRNSHYYCEDNIKENHVNAKRNNLLKKRKTYKEIEPITTTLVTVVGQSQQIDFRPPGFNWGYPVKEEEEQEPLLTPRLPTVRKLEFTNNLNNIQLAIDLLMDLPIDVVIRNNERCNKK